MRAVPGVREANPIAFQSVQLEYGIWAGRPPFPQAARWPASRFEMVLDRKAGIPIGTRIPMGRMTFTLAVINDPAVILADEPTAALETERGRAVMELMRNLGRTQHAAVIVVTHDERMIEGFDRVYHMIDGRIASH